MTSSTAADVHPLHGLRRGAAGPRLHSTDPTRAAMFARRRLIDAIATSCDDEPPRHGDDATWVCLLVGRDYKGAPFASIDAIFDTEDEVREEYISRLLNPDDPNFAANVAICVGDPQHPTVHALTYEWATTSDDDERLHMDTENLGPVDCEDMTAVQLIEIRNTASDADIPW